MMPPFFMQPPYPAFRAHPRPEARAIRHGFPWVLPGRTGPECRLGGLVPAVWYALRMPEGRPLGIATLNPTARSSPRVLGF